jgi:hypothetical protein
VDAVHRKNRPAKMLGVPPGTFHQPIFDVHVSRQRISAGVRHRE